MRLLLLKSDLSNTHESTKRWEPIVRKPRQNEGMRWGVLKNGNDA